MSNPVSPGSNPFSVAQPASSADLATPSEAGVLKESSFAVVKGESLGGRRKSLENTRLEPLEKKGGSLSDSERAPRNRQQFKQVTPRDAAPGSEGKVPTPTPTQSPHVSASNSGSELSDNDGHKTKRVPPNRETEQASKSSVAAQEGQPSSSPLSRASKSVITPRPPVEPPPSSPPPAENKVLGLSPQTIPQAPLLLAGAPPEQTQTPPPSMQSTGGQPPPLPQKPPVKESKPGAAPATKQATQAPKGAGRTGFLANIRKGKTAGGEPATTAEQPPTKQQAGAAAAKKAEKPQPAAARGAPAPQQQPPPAKAAPGVQGQPAAAKQPEPQPVKESVQQPVKESVQQPVQQPQQQPEPRIPVAPSVQQPVQQPQQQPEPRIPVAPSVQQPVQQPQQQQQPPPVKPPAGAQAAGASVQPPVQPPAGAQAAGASVQPEEEEKKTPGGPGGPTSKPGTPKSSRTLLPPAGAEAAEGEAAELSAASEEEEVEEVKEEVQADKSALSGADTPPPQKNAAEVPLSPVKTPTQEPSKIGNYLAAVPPALMAISALAIFVLGLLALAGVYQGANLGWINLGLAAGGGVATMAASRGKLHGCGKVTLPAALAALALVVVSAVHGTGLLSRFKLGTAMVTASGAGSVLSFAGYAARNTTLSDLHAKARGKQTTATPDDET